MSRLSTNQYDKNGAIVNGFDYNLQVWVKNYIIQNCGHPKEWGNDCCNSRKLKGKTIGSIPYSEQHILINQ